MLQSFSLDHAGVIKVEFECNLAFRPVTGGDLCMMGQGYDLDTFIVRLFRHDVATIVKHSLTRF